MEPRTKIFFPIFLATGFLMKILGEVVHELFGHGFFVLLFGGRITGFHISLLWPYEFSWIGWSLPGATQEQKAWVIGGGILVCLLVSYAIQVLLLLNRIPWQFSAPLFWLSFWCCVNATGYLIIGGLSPFGDVGQLIYLGVLTAPLATALGAALFLLGFFSLSLLLRRILKSQVPEEKAGWGVVAFWFITPVLVALNMLGHERLPFSYLPIGFIPVLLSFLIEFYVVKTRLFRR